MGFCITNGYIERDDNEFHDASERTDEFQDKVYSFADRLFNDNSYKSVADVGCGSAFKLNKYFKISEYKVGYDLEPTVSILKNRYPDGNWLVSDFDSNPLKVDLVVCADVIEHVTDPNKLLVFIEKMRPKSIVISTPDRDLLHEKLGRSYYGPPKNKHHIREWAFEEFYNYISGFFKVLDHFKIDREFNQVINCVLKRC